MFHPIFVNYMEQQIINNGESGLSVRNKINGMFANLISGSEGVNAIWKQIGINLNYTAEIGNVETLNATSKAWAEIYITGKKFIFNFGIPQGYNGGMIIIRKTYSSVAEMNADKNPTGDDGLIIAGGQIVSVFNPSNPDENAFYSRTADGWKLQLGVVKEFRDEMTSQVNSVKQKADESKANIQSLVNALPVTQTTGDSTTSVMSQKAVTDELNSSGKFATGEKVKDTSITNEISANNNGLPKSSAVYNALAPLRYSTYNDITLLAIQQSSGTQTQVYYNISGNITVAGYGSAYKLVLPEGTTKVKVSNASNSPYFARLVMFNGDTVVTVYKQADLTAEPFIISIPNNVTALGINRDIRNPMFTVEQVEDHVGVDGSIIADNSVTKSKLAADVKADLMSTDSEKYALLQAVNNNAYPLRETILQYPVSRYTLAFPEENAAWGAEKYDYPIEIIGFRIWSLSAQSASVYIYNTTSLLKVVEKTASLSVGENVVMLDSPYVLKNGDIACVTAKFAGFFDNYEKQVGLYTIDLSTGVLTPSPRNAYAFTVIYRGAEYPQSSSILYTKDFTEEENNGDFKETSSGTIVETSSGMTLANNNYIYLNRMYASNKTIRIQCLLYSTTVLKFGYRNNKTSQPRYVFTVDCANSKIKIGTTEEAFTVTNGGRYCIDIIKSSNIAILRVSDYKSCNVVSITEWAYDQDDLPLICLDSGTSPLIESYSVLSGVCEPYILFFGDSITCGAQTPTYHGQFLARFGDMIGKKTGKPYLVSGRAGSPITFITDEVVGRMFTEAKILRPKFVYVTIGTNGGNTEGNLTTLVKKLSDFGCKVILNNVPNRTYNGAEVDIAPTNELLAQIRETFGLSGVKNELACSVNNDGVTTNTALFGAAEARYVIHPNGEGHYQMFLRTFIDCPEIYTQAGVLPVPDDVPSGTTSERPANTPAGFIYYDTTLGYHIWSNGDGGWVDKDGNSR